MMLHHCHLHSNLTPKEFSYHFTHSYRDWHSSSPAVTSLKLYCFQLSLTAKTISAEDSLAIIYLYMDTYACRHRMLPDFLKTNFNSFYRHFYKTTEHSFLQWYFWHKNTMKLKLKLLFYPLSAALWLRWCIGHIPASVGLPCALQV